MKPTQTQSRKSLSQSPRSYWTVTEGEGAIGAKSNTAVAGITTVLIIACERASERLPQKRKPSERNIASAPVGEVEGGIAQPPRIISIKRYGGGGENKETSAQV